ncbi:hypothetical protein CR513_09209, partial [Mucuna pruriens]
MEEVNKFVYSNILTNNLYMSPNFEYMLLLLLKPETCLLLVQPIALVHEGGKEEGLKGIARLLNINQRSCHYSQWN